MDIYRRACVLLVLAAACGRAGESPQGGDADRATGDWALELRLEQPPRPRLDAAHIPPVRGELVLLRQPPGREAAGPTHYGTHAIDPRPFGITLRHGRVRGALAWARRDSLTVVLDPEEPGGGLVLRGVFSADSAAGRWSWHGAGLPSPSASGRFVLRPR